jgi:hypothetical protein
MRVPPCSIAAPRQIAFSRFETSVIFTTLVSRLSPVRHHRPVAAGLLLLLVAQATKTRLSVFQLFLAACVPMFGLRPAASSRLRTFRVVRGLEESVECAFEWPGKSTHTILGLDHKVVALGQALGVGELCDGATTKDFLRHCPGRRWTPASRLPWGPRSKCTSKIAIGSAKGLAVTYSCQKMRGRPRRIRFFVPQPPLALTGVDRIEGSPNLSLSDHSTVSIPMMLCPVLRSAIRSKRMQVGSGDRTEAASP